MLHRKLSGRDLHSPTNETVENKSGSTIPALKVVRLNGMGTVYPKVNLAEPSTYNNLGITYDEIPNNGAGQVCALGFMIGVDTSPWAPGTILYSDSTGNLSTTPLGGIVASVIKQDPTYGILYIITESIVTTAWAVGGNSLTDPSVNYIGTNDNADLTFKTNSNEAARLTSQGKLGLGIASPKKHFHQKSHVGPGNGRQTETWGAVTASSGFEVCYTLAISDFSVVSFEFSAIARKVDGTARASFKRSGLVYKESSNVIMQGTTWQSDFTIKSDTNFDIDYELTSNSLILKIKSSDSSPTEWSGSIIVEEN